MSRNAASPSEAASHLIALLKPPTESSVSVSTYFRAGQPKALRVSILPQHRYLVARIPCELDGYEILYTIADLPSAY